MATNLPNMRTRLAAALFASALAVSGCGSSSGEPQFGASDSSAKDNDMTPIEQLLARASAEDAASMYKGQLVRVREALTKLAPNVAWDDQTPTLTGGSLCRDPFGDIEGARVFGYATGGGGAIPDQDWDQAIKTTAAVLKPDGYDRVAVTVNKPGQHDVSFYGTYGNIVTISGQLSTSIELTESGCYMTAAAQEKARSHD